MRIISYDINSKSDLQFEEHKEVLEEHEEIIFVHFLSDYDPSLMLLVTYNRTLNQSYIKFLKIYNKIEQEEDWKSSNENHENEERPNLSSYLRIEPHQLFEFEVKYAVKNHY